MRSSRRYLYSSFGLSVFASLWTLLNIHFGSWILISVWFFLAITFAGSLIAAQFLNTRDFSFSEWLIYTTGLGLLQLLALGLILNTIGLNIHHATLTRGVVTVVLETVLALLSLFAILRKRVTYLLPDIQTDTKLTKVVTLGPFIFPLISVLGANRLNNGVSGWLTIVLYICMMAFVGFIIRRKDLLNERTLCSTLWGISFAILLSVSMRSNYFIGYDINQEFQVFSATLNAGLWHPHLFKDTYNACLSITILPTMLKVLMPISAQYLFKFVMQGILSFASIGVYVLAKYLLRNNKKVTVYAFISALFFIIQYQFLNEFPALIREQTATVFFALVFISATNSKMSKNLKSVLLLLFGLGMIVSHYSTAYICLGLLVLMIGLKPLLVRVSNYFKSSRAKAPQTSSWYISPLLVIVMFLIAFMWYGEILNSTGGVVQKISSSVTNFGQIFSSDSRSPFVNATLGFSPYSETPQLLSKVSDARQSSNGYSSLVTDNYQVSPALTPAPKAKTGSQAFLLKTINSYIPALVKLVVIVGALSIVSASIRYKRAIEEGALVISAGIIFVLLIVLPSLSQDYNLERLYQQLLVLLSASFALGISIIIDRVKARYTEVAVFLLLGAYFLCTSGIISQLAFGMSNINFDKLDLNYLHFYSTDGDIDSLRWLQEAYHQNPSIINLDEYSKLKTYSSITGLPAYNLVPGLLPSQMSRSSYVYASHINLQQNIVFDSYNKQALSYTFPENFLETNKNTIYSNGDSNIYR